MRHTKEQIIEKAKKIMDIIEWRYAEEGIVATFNPKEDEIAKAYKYLKDMEILELAIQNAKPDHWSVGFEFDAESEIEYNTMFMDLWDETGEPFAVLHKQARFNIKKDKDGNYYTEYATGHLPEGFKGF